MYGGSTQRTDASADLTGQRVFVRMQQLSSSAYVTAV